MGTRLTNCPISITPYGEVLHAALSCKRMLLNCTHMITAVLHFTQLILLPNSAMDERTKKKSEFVVLEGQNDRLHKTNNAKAIAYYLLYCLHYLDGMIFVDHGTIATQNFEKKNTGH